MSIESKVREVEKLFERLDIEINGLKKATQLHCISGCGKCCTKPDIEASPLEFLPWAFHLFLNGQAETMLKELQNRSSSFCQLFTPLTLIDKNNGSCSHYDYRGLICRLFGYAASRDKYGLLRLATCKIIKEDQPQNFADSEEAISKGLYVPIFSDYYMNLSQIDYTLGSLILPINKAIIRAIEEVLQYYAYRPFPGGLENIA